MPKPDQTLTDEAIAAIAAGATLQAGAVTTSDAAAAPGATTETGASGAAAGAENDAAARQAQEQGAGEGKDEVKDKPAAGAQTESEMLAFLRSELAARDQAIVDLRVEKANLDTRLAAVDKTHAPLLAIARDSIAKMQTALRVPGVTAESLAGIDADKLLSMHAEVQATFKSKFQVGGVAVTAPEEAAAAESKATVTPLRQAQLHAVRFNNKS